MLRVKVKNQSPNCYQIAICISVHSSEGHLFSIEKLKCCIWFTCSRLAWELFQLALYFGATNSGRSINTQQIIAFLLCCIIRVAFVLFPLLLTVAERYSPNSRSIQNHSIHWEINPSTRPSMHVPVSSLSSAI